MKSLLILLFVFASVSQKELNEIRLSFKEASSNETSATNFYNMVQSIDDNSPLVLAYDGAGEVIYSKFLDSKADKLSHFKTGTSRLEEAIEIDSDDIEIRFIRLVIQEQTPGFLGYNDNIDDDVSFIMDNFVRSSENVKTMILDYIDSSDNFTPEQKNELKN
ncbi:MAG: hypothetical protein WEA99_11925 [Brumimicrobium sp.]